MDGPDTILVSCSQPGNHTSASPGCKVTCSGCSTCVGERGMVGSGGERRGEMVGSGGGRGGWWGVVVVGGGGGGVNYARTSVQSPTASSVTGYSHHVFLPTTCTEILLVHIRSMCLLAPQGGWPQCSHSLPGRGGGQTLVSRSQTLM